MSMRDALNISSYLVIGPENTCGRPVGDVISSALAAGFTCVQVRSKVCSARELMACADEAAHAIERAGSPTFPLKRAASSSAPMRSWVSPRARTRCSST